MEVFNRVKNTLDRLQYTELEAVSKRASLHLNTLYHIRQGKTWRPSFSTVSKLHDALSDLGYFDFDNDTLLHRGVDKHKDLMVTKVYWKEQEFTVLHKRKLSAYGYKHLPNPWSKDYRNSNHINQMMGIIAVLDLFDVKRKWGQNWGSSIGYDHMHFFSVADIDFCIDAPYHMTELSPEFRYEWLPTRLNIYSPHTHCRISAKLKTDFDHKIFDLVVDTLLKSDIDVWPGHEDMRPA